MTVLACLLPPASMLCAGQIEIKHETEKLSIETQIKKTASETEITKDKQRLTVGIGEVITLTIEGSGLPEPVNLKETTWRIVETKGGAAARFQALPQKNTPSSKLLALDPYCAEMDAREAAANPEGAGGGQTATGESVGLKIIVTNVSPDASVTIEADYEGRKERVIFTVLKPLRWLVVHNAGENKTRIIPYASEEAKAGKQSPEAVVAVQQSAVYLLCQPCNANFEHLYFQEIDLASPINIKPDFKENDSDRRTIGETMFEHKFHITGDYWDGAPRTGDTRHRAIHKIDYSNGLGQMSDNIGGGLHTNGLVSDDYLKSGLDRWEGFEFSFEWHCGWKLYDTDKIPPGFKQPLPMPPKPPNPLTPFSEMESCIQKFSSQKLGDNSYSTKVTKWEARSERIVNLRDEYVEITYDSKPVMSLSNTKTPTPAPSSIIPQERR